MCGISGYYSQGVDDGVALLTAMTDTLSHRGPDDAGRWHDPSQGIGLGHRRLAILDLSPLGRQPMESKCGRYVVVFNGEIFNFRELRDELRNCGHNFHGGSDTEVVLAAISEWGLSLATRRLIGMFAIALWSREDRTLSLVRDRLGIKPLYYVQTGEGVFFASELKAIRSVPSFTPSIDRHALTLYFRHNYIPSPYSIYCSAVKVGPGEIVRFSAPEVKPAVEVYWSALDVWNNGAQNEFLGTMVEAELEVDRLLNDSTRLRMVSDVPLGALLSGGVDSSLIVALMQQNSDRAVRTFSIGFGEKEYDESFYASKIAEHLGSKHTRLQLGPEDMLRVIPDMPQTWDEPFSDSSQIPMYCVCELTRQHVTVALTGDGGDELFGGYQRYLDLTRLRYLRMAPPGARRALRTLMGHIPERFFDALGAFGFKVKWRLEMLTIDNFRDFYKCLISREKSPERLVIGGHEPEYFMNRSCQMEFSDELRQMTYWDVAGYLPDDILVKADRSSMAFGLELRTPFLDHRLVEFAASLPSRMKVQGSEGKVLLRNILKRYVPEPLVDRKKMGFGVPVLEWLRGDLHEWFNDMLNVNVIRSQGYLDAERVETMRRKFNKGEIAWCHRLWDVLMFQAWLEQWT